MRDYDKQQNRFRSLQSNKDLKPFEVPQGFLIRVIAPFCGADARFQIYKKGTEESISVYLDTTQALGCYDGPYWELYPYKGDTWRCDMVDIDEVIALCVEELNR